MKESDLKLIDELCCGDPSIRRSMEKTIRYIDHNEGRWNLLIPVDREEALRLVLARFGKAPVPPSGRPGGGDAPVADREPGRPTAGTLATYFRWLLGLWPVGQPSGR